jgi:hypothetical protein
MLVMVGQERYLCTVQRKPSADHNHKLGVTSKLTITTWYSTNKCSKRSKLLALGG